MHKEGVIDAGGRRRKDRFIPFTTAIGISDIIGIMRDGRFLAIECKVGRNKPTPDQQSFLDRVAKCGGVAIVAYSWEDVDAVIRPQAE